MTDREEWEKERIKTEKLAKRLGHISESKSNGFIDGCICSCGWESKDFWDGAEYAYDEWLKHAKEAIEAGQAQLIFS